jgi:hypothetical protein
MAWRRAVVLLGLLVALAACSRSVAGTPTVAGVPPSATPLNASVPTQPVPAGSASARSPTPSAAGSPAPTAVPELESDVLADECLLDTGDFGALLGRDVLPPEQTVVRRDDGSRSSSCYANAAKGVPTPLAAINVYRVRSGTPAQFVHAASGRGRPLAGAGEAAALFDTAAGPTLQVAGRQFLVTVVVLGRGPSDDAWRTAATGALARLPT